MEQLEYNNETLAQATNVQEEVEMICRWAAARAAGIAALPKFNYAGLLANDVYMVSRIAKAYGVCPAKEGITGFLVGLGGSAVAALVCTIVPSIILRVPVAAAITYGVGKMAAKWIEDGMPSDIERYKPMIAEFYESGKAIAGEIARDAAASIPFTQGQRDVWAGIANETGLAKEQLEQVYSEKVAPAIEKWNTETKYQLHDNAAEVVAKVTDAAKEKIDVAKETLDTAKELAKGGVEVAKATTQVAVENAKTTAAQAVENAKDTAFQAVETVKETTKSTINGFRK